MAMKSDSETEHIANKCLIFFFRTAGYRQGNLFANFSRDHRSTVKKHITKIKGLRRTLGGIINKLKRTFIDYILSPQHGLFQPTAVNARSRN